MRKQDRKKTGRRGRKTRSSKGMQCKSGSQRRTHTPDVCKALVKAKRIKETKTFGVEVWTLSSCFIFQKLLNDKKIHGTSIASSEIKDQNSQEPLKEEEYKKLRDILQQRDNEISILSEVMRKSSTGLKRGTLSCLPLTTHPSSPPRFQLTLLLSI